MRHGTFANVRLKGREGGRATGSIYRFAADDCIDDESRDASRKLAPRLKATNARLFLQQPIIFYGPVIPLARSPCHKRDNDIQTGHTWGTQKKEKKVLCGQKLREHRAKHGKAKGTETKKGEREREGEGRKKGE